MGASRANSIASLRGESYTQFTGGKTKSINEKNSLLEREQENRTIGQTGAEKKKKRLIQYIQAQAKLEDDRAVSGGNVCKDNSDSPLHWRPNGRRQGFLVRDMKIEAKCARKSYQRGENAAQLIRKKGCQRNARPNRYKKKSAKNKKGKMPAGKKEYKGFTFKHIIEGKKHETKDLNKQDMEGSIRKYRRVRGSFYGEGGRSFRT